MRPFSRASSSTGSDRHAVRKRSNTVPVPSAQTTTFRSMQMAMHIDSPSVKTVWHEADGQHRFPVFGDYDRVGGRIVLDPSCLQPGRLSIKLEGTFRYISPQTEAQHDSTVQIIKNCRHIFLSSTIVIPVLLAPDNGSPRSAFRDALSATVRRQNSLSNISSSTISCSQRSFPFSFELPRGARPGEEMPPTFSSSNLVETSPRGRAFVETAEVAYTVSATWEVDRGSADPATLEAPILFQPDTDFQSLDALCIEPNDWLELPLRSEKPMSFSCAVTLPNPSMFSRLASVPYFVVFTTSPRSLPLAREIATDATIAISLIRQVTISTAHLPPPTPPSSPSSSGEEADPQPRQRLLKRVAQNTSPMLVRGSRFVEDERLSVSKDKPLPLTPSEMSSFLESRTLQTSFSIGFPKRPRNKSSPGGHPKLESHNSLPDGLFKGSLQLNKEMLPCIDWAGINVKYYLDVSVLFEQDELRARVPIRIF